LGGYLLKEFAKKDENITATFRNSNQIVSYDNVNWVKHNVLIDHPNKILLRKHYQKLIHLAWSNVQDVQNKSHIDSQLPGHYKFLKSAVESGIKEIICIGTCFEYGGISAPYKSSDVTKPNTKYGIAKDCLRKKIELLKSSYDFKFIWIRLFFIYGEGQPLTTIYGQLKHSVENGKSLFNMSNGEQVRDYMHVKDVAKAIIHVSKNDSCNGVINICSGQKKKLKNTVSDWIKINNWDIKLNLGHFAYRDYEPMIIWGIPNLLL